MLSVFEECVSVIPSVCFALFHRISVRNSGLYVGGSYPVYFVCYLRGNAVRFFAAHFFGDLGYVLGKILLMSGPPFGKIFGSELLFLSVVVGLVFFESVLPRFLLYYLIFRSRKCLGKILLMSGPLFEKIFGSELLFLVSVLVVCFFCAVLPMFLLYYLVFRSRKCLEKILLMSGLVFLGFLDWLSGVFRGDFSGPEMPHFCCSLSLSLSSLSLLHASAACQLYLNNA